MFLKKSQFVKKNVGGARFLAFSILHDGKKGGDRNRLYCHMNGNSQSKDKYICLEDVH